MKTEMKMKKTKKTNRNYKYGKINDGFLPP